MSGDDLDEFFLYNLVEEEQDAARSGQGCLSCGVVIVLVVGLLCVLSCGGWFVMRGS